MYIESFASGNGKLLDIISRGFGSSQIFRLQVELCKRNEFILFSTRQWVVHMQQVRLEKKSKKND
jgi:hypothetical protein